MLDASHLSQVRSLESEKADATRARANVAAEEAMALQPHYPGAHFPGPLFPGPHFMPNRKP
jgi:hypothetical protein